MARRRQEIPPGIEIVDADGSTVATGETPADPVATAPGRRLTPKRTVAVLAVLVAGLAVVGFLTRPDRVEYADPTPPPAMFEQSDISIQQSDTIEATFPLLGLEWDHDLVANRDVGWERIDLNTGEVTTFGRFDEPFGQFFFATTVVDGTLFAESFDGVYRVSENSTEPLLDTRESVAFGGAAIAGHYFVHAGDRTSGVFVTTLKHLTTGETVELADAGDHGAIGDVIFTHHGGVIASRIGNADPSTWAEGEMLGFGPNHLAWRHCDAPASCRYWIGTPDQPRSRPLDEATARKHLAAPVGFHSLSLRGLALDSRVLSPSGRYMLAPEFTTTEASGQRISLVDLETGAEVEIPGALESLPTWSPGEEIVVVTQFDRITAIDTATGETHRLPVRVETTGGNTLTFVPST